MKYLISVSLLLFLFACGEDDNNDKKVAEDVDFTKENVVGSWVLVNKITKKEFNNSPDVSYDTTNYGHEISLYEDGKLDWSGDIIHNWGDDTLQGSGNGIWFFVVDSNAFENNKIVRIHLYDAFTFDSTDFTEDLDIIGQITKFYGNELILEQYLLDQNNNRYTSKYKLNKN